MAKSPAAEARPAEAAPRQPDQQMISVTSAANLLKTSEQEIRELSVRHILPPIRKGEMPFVATVQRYIEHKRDGRRSVHLAGEIIGKSAQWVRKLIEWGYIVKQPDGMVLERDVVLGYIRFLTDEQRRASKSQAESRVRDARAREIELRIAEREGRLAELGDLEGVLDEYIGTMRAELAGLPARVTRDLVQRRTIEAAIDDILHRCAAASRQALALLAPGDHANGAGESADAGQVGGSA